MRKERMMMMEKSETKNTDTRKKIRKKDYDNEGGGERERREK